MSEPPARPGPSARLAAWSVHALTATGAVWAVFALDALAREQVGLALRWMALAVVVDGIDGPLARRFRVRQVLPRIDGALLDNLVDYLGYVAVPACFFLFRVVPLPDGTAPIAAAAVCSAGAYQFVQSGAKTPESFVGFPSYWNVVVFYLLVFEAAPALVLGVVVALAVLSFVPLPWIHPTRTRPWRTLTLTLTALWAGSIGLLLLQFPDPSPWLARAGLGYVAYYVALSLWLARRKRQYR